MKEGPDLLSTDEDVRVYADNTKDMQKPALMKQATSPKQYNFLAFIIPFLILALSYATRMVFPFGNRQLLTVDLFHQYAPFMSLLRRSILSGDSLFYSFAGGLGINLYALISYYLASPFNLLLLIFPESFLAEAIFLMTLIKVGFAGLSFHLFLKEHYSRRGVFSVIFASFYALSSYTMAYSWNIMWLDALILLPLVLWALIRFIKKGKYFSYILLLALLVLTNYYVAFFACIFIALFLPIIMSNHTVGWTGKERFKVFLKLAGATVLAIALTSFMLLPTIESLKYTSASGDSFPDSLQFNGNPLSYIAQHFILLEPTIRSGSPNLYSGIAVLLLIPIYFMSERIRLREKVMHLSLLIFLLLSFDINYLNFLWHGMHFPNQLPYRYSFVFIFLILTMAYGALRSVRDFSVKDIVLLTLPLLMLVPVSIILLDDLSVSPATQWVTIAFILIYALVFSAFSRSRLKIKPISERSNPHRRLAGASLALIVVMLIELVLHSIVSIYFVDKNEYYGLREGYAAGNKPAAIRAALADIESNYQDGLFYRAELNKMKCSNDPALYGYNGLSIFASTSAEAPVTFMKNMGFSSNGINSYKYSGSTLFLDSLFDIEFLLTRESLQQDNRLRQEIFDNGEVQVYQNPYVMPLGFVADKSLLTYHSSSGAIFDNQNRLAQHIMPDIGLLFREISVWETGDSDHSSASGRSSFSFHKINPDDTYTVFLNSEIEDSGNYYIYMDSKRNDMDKAVLRDLSDREIDLNATGLTEIGYLEKGELEIELILSKSAAENGSFDLFLAKMDDEELKRLSKETKQNALKLEHLDNDLIVGKFESPEAGVLFLSIPYDPSWTVWVDGELTEVKQMDNALMLIPVTEGEHQLKLQFKPQGFSVGLIITAAAAFIILVLFLITYFLRRRRNVVAIGKYVTSDDFLANDKYLADPVTKDLADKEVSPDIQLKTANDKGTYQDQNKRENHKKSNLNNSCGPVYDNDDFKPDHSSESLEGILNPATEAQTEYEGESISDRIIQKYQAEDEDQEEMTYDNESTEHDGVD